MLPTKLTGKEPEEERSRYKIVRSDSLTEVPGLIMSADATTGLCSLKTFIVGGDTITNHNFGPDGFRIVPASR